MFQHINLPAIAQRDELIALGGSRTKARKVGDVLFESSQSRATLERIRLEQGPTYFGAQYLQDPTPVDSSLIRWHDIQRYDEPPERDQLTKVVQSWDTAETASIGADWSVCTTWGFHEGRWLLLDLIRIRLSFRDLLDRAKAHGRLWKPDLIIIEEAGSGRHLLAELVHELRTGHCQSK